jgi:hypothetical protein
MAVVEGLCHKKTFPALNCGARVPVRTLIRRPKWTVRWKVLKSLRNDFPICVDAAAVIERVVELLGT